MPIRKDLFDHVLSQLEYGRTKEELDQATFDLKNACAETGKPGKLTLTISLKPRSQGQQIIITPDVKVACPRLDREETLFFPVEDGLSRNDPKQRELPGLRNADDIKPTNFKVAK